MAEEKGEGREGDWRCEGCGNRNYAFRTFCNRCKQARLFVDSRTPADSKWLPRIGDWICADCSNNNYSSRSKCNKCGQPKEVSALPAIAMPGAAMAAPIVPRVGPFGGLGMSMNMTYALPSHQTQNLGINWSSNSSGLGASMPDNENWRHGDWRCYCGFHNYASRVTCKKCSMNKPMAMPVSGVASSTLCSMQQPSFYTCTGVKRDAVDNTGADWSSKRLNLGVDLASQPYQNFAQPWQNQQAESFLGYEERSSFLPNVGTAGVPNSGVAGANTLVPNLGISPQMQPPCQQNITLVPYSGATGGNVSAPNFGLSSQMPPPIQQNITLVPAFFGKGAKQWRSGDWMCSSCSNHNYASRDSCNRYACSLGTITMHIGMSLHRLHIHMLQSQRVKGKIEVAKVEI